MYYTYMLRCKDKTIYTGMTSDLERRLKEHITKDEKCAKYTLNHTAIKLEIAWESETRSQASKLEYYIKTLKKAEKENLINNPSNLINLLSNKIENNLYKKIDTEEIQKRVSKQKHP